MLLQTSLFHYTSFIWPHLVQSIAAYLWTHLHTFPITFNQYSTPINCSLFVNIFYILWTCYSLSSICPSLLNIGFSLLNLFAQEHIFYNLWTCYWELFGPVIAYPTIQSKLTSFAHIIAEHNRSLSSITHHLCAVVMHTFQQSLCTYSSHHHSCASLCAVIS